MPSACPLCGHSSTPTLADRPDHEHGVPTRLAYRRCDGCGLVYADPVPSGLVPSFYATYSTHAAATADPHPLFWRTMRAVTPAPDRAAAFGALEVAKTSRVLDFGCGAGDFLADLQRAGFTRLSGYDFDPRAAAGRLSGVRLFESAAAMSAERFDVITMLHVLEHLEDPASTLRGLLGLLAPGGRIYVRTPNAASLLARVFRGKWRGWETPRHLRIFSPANLPILVERAGGKLESLTTSNDMLPGILVGSIGNVTGEGLAKKLACAALYAPGAWAAWAARLLFRRTGEELVAVLRP